MTTLPSKAILVTQTREKNVTFITTEWQTFSIHGVFSKFKNPVVDYFYCGETDDYEDFENPEDGFHGQYESEGATELEMLLSYTNFISSMNMRILRANYCEYNEVF